MVGASPKSDSRPCQGRRAIPGCNTHDDVAARGGLGQFRNQRVAVIIPADTVRYMHTCVRPTRFGVDVAHSEGGQLV